MSVVAVAPRGSMFNPGPCVYMEKIATGREGGKFLDIAAPDRGERPPRGQGQSMQPEDITVVILDRDRHQEFIERVRRIGARVYLITDGDVAGAITAAQHGTGVDLLYGIGGTPEGVVAAAALKCLGGEIQGRLYPRNDEERRAALDAGYDLDRVLTTDDLVRGDDVFFAATGITDGVLLEGVRVNADGASTESIVMRSRSGTIRVIRAEHRWDKLMPISAIDYTPEAPAAVNLRPGPPRRPASERAARSCSGRDSLHGARSRSGHLAATRTWTYPVRSATRDGPPSKCIGAKRDRQLVRDGSAGPGRRIDRDHRDQAVGGDLPVSLADFLPEHEARPAEPLGAGHDGQHFPLAAFPPEIEIEVHGDGHGTEGEQPLVGQVMSLVPLFTSPLHVFDILGIVYMTVHIDLGRPDDDLEKCLHDDDTTPEDLSISRLGAVHRPPRGPPPRGSVSQARPFSPPPGQACVKRRHWPVMMQVPPIKPGASTCSGTGMTAVHQTVIATITGSLAGSPPRSPRHPAVENPRAKN